MSITRRASHKTLELLAFMFGFECLREVAANAENLAPALTTNTSSRSAQETKILIIQEFYVKVTASR
jgi:hypothetical protein